MNKKRASEPNVLQAADSRLQKNPAENIPVFLVLALCLLAVSLFSNQSYLFQEDFTPAADSENYVWISGLNGVKEGLYLLTPDQLAETFPELQPLMGKTPNTPGPDPRVSAFRYESGSPQPVDLPPAVANIFFQPISINRADKEILSTLPGIGPKLAGKIVRRRESKGPFRSKDELLQITGIGPEKLARLVDRIILD